MGTYAVNRERHESFDHARERPFVYPPVDHTKLLGTSKEISDALASFDEGRLLASINHFVQKSGAEPTKNWVPFNTINIEPVQSKEKLATFNYLKGITFFSHEDEAASLPHVLWNVVHEELHAVTTTNYVQNEITNDVYQESGVEQHAIERNGTTGTFEHFKKFTLLNEGITEYITWLVIADYLLQTGYSAMTQAEFRPLTADRLANESQQYGVAVNLVFAYASFLAAVAGVGVDIVLDSMIRMYFKNGQVIPTDIARSIGVNEDAWIDLLIILESNDPAALGERVLRYYKDGTITFEQAQAYFEFYIGLDQSFKKTDAVA